MRSQSITLTPWDLAYDSIDAPTPESIGSTSRTLAPLVMADWAWLSWVASLPWALVTVYCDDVRPAACNALVRYGASKDVYRADVVVSGSRTPTDPLP